MTDPIKDPTGKPLRERNPITEREYRRDILRQVTLPILFFLIVLGGGIYWAVIAEIASVERWAEIALLTLLVPALGIGIAILIVLASIVYFVSVILQVLPPYARDAQDAIVMIKQRIEEGAEVSVRPVIQIQSFIAMVESIFGKG